MRENRGHGPLPQGYGSGRYRYRYRYRYRRPSNQTFSRLRQTLASHGCCSRGKPVGR